MLREIEYSEWLKYVRAVTKNGRRCDEFEELMTAVPSLCGTDYEDFALSEIARLEVQLIKDSISDFQKAINRSLEESDIYIFEKGLKAFKRSIKENSFYNKYDNFSRSSKDMLNDNLQRNYLLFADELSRYLRKSDFEEMNYIYKRANIKKFIQEQTVYE